MHRLQIRPIEGIFRKIFTSLALSKVNAMTIKPSHLTLFLFVFLIPVLETKAQNHLWSNAFVSQPDFWNDFEEVYAVRYDSQGNLYTLLSNNGQLTISDGTIQFDCTGNMTNLVLLKQNSDGEIIWLKDFDWMPEYSGMFRDGLAVDAEDNLLMFGAYSGTIDLLPGPDVYNLTSTGAYDAYVIKFDSDGEIVWANSFGGPGDENVRSLTFAPTGDILLSGYYHAGADMNPGPSIFTFSELASAANVYCSRWTSNGDFIWSGSIHSSGSDWAGSLGVDGEGNVYISGFWSNGALDTDPSATVFSLSYSGGQDSFLVKWDSDGNWVWAKKIGGSGFDHIMDLSVSINGDVYIVAQMPSGVDLDPGPGTATIPSFGTAQGVIAKYNSNGVYQWHATIGGPQGGGQFHCIDWSEESQSLWCGGLLMGEVDMDSGPELFTWEVGNIGGSAGLVNYNSNGDFLTGWALNGAASSKIKSISSFEDRLTLGGYFYNSIDVHPGPEEVTYNVTGSELMGYYHGFMATYEINACGFTWLDLGSNVSATCYVQGQLQVELLNSSAPVIYSWNGNPYGTETSFTSPIGGVFTVSAIDNSGCEDTRNLYLFGPSNLSEYDLGVQFIAETFRPLVLTEATLDAYNLGCVSQNAILTMEITSNVNFISANPAPSTISGNTFTWNINDFSFDSGHFIIDLDLMTVETASIGDLVGVNITITPSQNDFNIIDNSMDYEFQVVNSYDPNDKHVHPKGIGEEGFVAANSLMTYTVRFQNTGNAEAINITILDTIHPYLDLSTFEILSQSHSPMDVIVGPDREMKFVFNNINLPDSASNPEESQGYIIYRIAQMPDLAPGIQWTNTAYIYFDNNDPIITNTTVNTIDIPDIISEDNHKKSKVILYPNPTSSGSEIRISSSYNESESVIVNIRDMKGRIVIQEQIIPNSTNSINVQVPPNFSDGIYLVEISTPRSSTISKLVVLAE